MDPVLGYSLLATVVVSLMSLVGILTLSVNRDFLNKILLVLISLSAGTLMGDVFFHLLPEAVADSGFTTELSAWILGGFIIFFILEKFVMWHHHHSIESPDEHEKGDHTHHRSIGIMNLMGDAIHNFLDGMIIVAAFMINPLVGMSTTLAIVLHEIPQEFGDFGVLIHSGYSVRKALLFNFLSAGFAILGALVAWFIGAQSEGFLAAVVPLVSGAFIYIAASDLIPELRKENGVSSSTKQLLALTVGILIMYGLTLVELVA